MRERVGLGDILRRGFDVLDDFAAGAQGLDGPLVLVQQRDGVDQGEILFMIAPGAGLVGEEGQAVGVGVDHGQGAQEALGVLMQGEQAGFVLPGGQPRQGALLALAAVDGFGLLAAFVHREHEAAVHQFLVDLDGRRRQEDHDRAFDAVLLGDEVAGSRVFARRWQSSIRLRTARASGHRRREQHLASSAMARILCLRFVSPM